MGINLLVLAKYLISGIVDLAADHCKVGTQTSLDQRGHPL